MPNGYGRRRARRGRNRRGRRRAGWPRVGVSLTVPDMDGRLTGSATGADPADRGCGPGSGQVAIVIEPATACAITRSACPPAASGPRGCSSAPTAAEPFTLGSRLGRALARRVFRVFASQFGARHRPRRVTHATGGRHICRQAPTRGSAPKTDSGLSFLTRSTAIGRTDPRSPHQSTISASTPRRPSAGPGRAPGPAATRPHGFKQGDDHVLTG